MSCCVTVVFTILKGALPFLLWDLIQAFLLNQLWKGPPAENKIEKLSMGPDTCGIQLSDGVLNEITHSHKFICTNQISLNVSEI